MRACRLTSSSRRHRRCSIARCRRRRRRRLSTKSASQPCRRTCRRSPTRQRFPIIRRKKGCVRAGTTARPGGEASRRAASPGHTAASGSAQEARERAAHARGRGRRRARCTCTGRNTRVHLLPAAPEGLFATAEEPPLPDILSCVETWQRWTSWVHVTGHTLINTQADCFVYKAVRLCVY